MECEQATSYASVNTAITMKTTMRLLIIFFTTVSFLTSCKQTRKNDKIKPQIDTCKIILITELPEPDVDQNTGEIFKTEIPGLIDTIKIKSLNQPIRALTAFYAAMGGSLCSGDHCDLTTALGLGKQGSSEHKALILKYFPNDKVAETMVNMDCYQSPSGASFFSDYEFLTIIKKGDTVEVDYRLMYYNRGEIIWFKGPDIYIFKENKFKKIKRNIWKEIDK